MHDPNRRKSGRLVCAGLISTMGGVMDLSAGGCRVVCQHWRALPEGTHIQIALEGEGMAVVMSARVVRRTKISMFRAEYGLEFVQVTPDQRSVLTALSHIATLKRVMPTMEEAANRAA